MPPIVASIIYLGAVAFLFRRELRRGRPTGAVWIPIIWMFTIGSRTPSQWFQVAGFNIGSGSITEEEGSPVDAAVYFLFILSGFIVLHRRRVDLRTIFRSNVWLTAFIAYCLVSCLWSDFPFVSFKRWVKILGHPIMMLILFTEEDPEEAMIRMIRLNGYLMIPISILFIKYFPQWGRGFDEWSGAPADTGITINKNVLGATCLVCDYFFFWDILRLWGLGRHPGRWFQIFVNTFLLVTGCWLLRQAHSSTSEVSFCIAVVAVLLLGRRFVSKERLGTFVFASVSVFLVFVAVTGLDLYHQSLSFLGKDPTLTDRTNVWALVLGQPFNPLIGTGFEAFWLGERRERIWAVFWWQPRQAHNGYLETFVNLGLIGLGLMITLIVTTFFKGKRMIMQDFNLGRFQLGFLAAFVFYNWTEAAFKALHIVWFFFYLISMEYRRPQALTAEAGSGAEGSAPSGSLNYA